MVSVMSDPRLRLNLSAGESLPCECSWRIQDGYLRLLSWGQDAEMLTLGIWGPGDLVVPSVIGVSPLELVSLSPIQVEQCDPSREEKHQFLCDQLQQVSSLLLLTKIRPVEERLFQLLIWLGERFGRVSSRGVSLSLEDMNLTHRNLAEISGSTRVTVTKALSRFRQEGRMLREGADELLLR